MFEKVKDTLLDYVDCNPDDITPETSFIKDLKMTSYDIITMVGQLESEFAITIDEEELQEIVDVGDLVRYLSDKI